MFACSVQAYLLETKCQSGAKVWNQFDYYGTVDLAGLSKVVFCIYYEELYKFQHFWIKHVCMYIPVSGPDWVLVL